MRETQRNPLPAKEGVVYSCLRNPELLEAHGDVINPSSRSAGATGSSEVVIIGAGFGGLQAARALRNAHARVTVIDRNHHHLFQPLLY